MEVGCRDCQSVTAVQDSDCWKGKAGEEICVAMSVMRFQKDVMAFERAFDGVLDAFQPMLRVKTSSVPATKAAAWPSEHLHN